MKVNRINNLLRNMENQGLEQIIVTSSPDIFYLTGKWISSGERMVALYLNKKGNHKLIVNKLFPIYEDLGVEIVWYTDLDDSVKLLSTIVDKEKALGVDKNWPSHFLIKLMEMKGAKAFVNSSPILDRLRRMQRENIRLMAEKTVVCFTVWG